MNGDLANNLNGEQTLAAWLASVFPGSRVCTETPVDLARVLPCLRVTTISNIADVNGFESGSFDVSVFNTDAASTLLTAGAVASALLNDIPQQTVGETFVESTGVRDVGETPWDNTNVRRRSLIVTLYLHTRRVA